MKIPSWQIMMMTPLTAVGALRGARKNNLDKRRKKHYTIYRT